MWTEAGATTRTPVAARRGDPRLPPVSGCDVPRWVVRVLLAARVEFTARHVPSGLALVRPRGKLGRRSQRLALREAESTEKQPGTGLQQRRGSRKKCVLGYALRRPNCRSIARRLLHPVEDVT